MIMKWFRNLFKKKKKSYPQQDKFKLCIITAGVFAGANNPVHPVAAKPGRPDSDSVGSSCNGAKRRGLLTAIP